MTQIWDVAVVGLGLFGSAAVRHLARAGAAVVGIGPGEPEVVETHDGVFASHYDSGRITRRIDPDPVWETLARRAIAEYPTIADDGGVDFHRPVGLLWVDQESKGAEAWSSRAESGEIDGKPAKFAERSGEFPYLAFPGDAWCAFEPGPAGHIDPRRMLTAQLAASRKAGATLLDDAVTARTESGGRHHVETSMFGTVVARNVVVATGAYTGRDHLLPRPLPTRVKTETIVLARLPRGAAEEFSGMPSVIFMIRDPDLEDIYVVPPVLYPDGHWYLKMGANTSADEFLGDASQIAHWMRAGDTSRQAAALTRAIRDMVPAGGFDAFIPKRCLITYTPGGRPYVDRVGPGLYVAAAGNGVGAKSSDAVGALVAGLVQAGEWVDDLPSDIFAVPASENAKT